MLVAMRSAAAGASSVGAPRRASSHPSLPCSPQPSLWPCGNSNNACTSVLGSAVARMLRASGEAHATATLLQPTEAALPRPRSCLFDLDDMDTAHFCVAMGSSPATQLPSSKPQPQPRQLRRSSDGNASQAAAAAALAGGQGLAHGSPFDRTNSGVLPEQFEPSQLLALLSGPMPRLVDACKPANAFEQQVAMVVKQLLVSSSSLPPTPWPSPHRSAPPTAFQSPTSAVAAAASAFVSPTAASAAVIPTCVSAPPSPPASPSQSPPPVLSPAVIEAIAAELLSLGYMVQVRDSAHDQQQHQQQSTGPDGRPQGHRTSITGPPQRDAFANLQHRFLTCTGFQASPFADPTYLPEPIVIEPRFRDQFVIQFNSGAPQYESVLSAVPQLFVGTLTRLEAAVEVMAAEITRAFKQQGRPLPPWRTHKSMMSKWAPEQLRSLSRLLLQSSSSCGSAMTMQPALSDPGQQQQARWQAAAAAASAVSAAGSVYTSMSGGCASGSVAMGGGGDDSVNAHQMWSGSGAAAGTEGADGVFVKLTGFGEDAFMFYSYDQHNQQPPQVPASSPTSLQQRFSMPAAIGGSPGAPPAPHHLQRPVAVQPLLVPMHQSGSPMRPSDDTNAHLHTGFFGGLIPVHPGGSPMHMGFQSMPPAGIVPGSIAAAMVATGASPSSPLNTAATAPPLGPAVATPASHSALSAAPTAPAALPSACVASPFPAASAFQEPMFQRIQSGDLRLAASKNRRCSGGLASAFKGQTAGSVQQGQVGGLAGALSSATAAATAAEPWAGASVQPSRSSQQQQQQGREQQGQEGWRGGERRTQRGATVSEPLATLRGAGSGMYAAGGGATMATMRATDVNASDAFAGFLSEVMNLASPTERSSAFGTFFAPAPMRSPASGPAAQHATTASGPGGMPAKPSASSPPPASATAMPAAASGPDLTSRSAAPAGTLSAGWHATPVAPHMVMSGAAPAAAAAAARAALLPGQSPHAGSASATAAAADAPAAGGFDAPPLTQHARRLPASPGAAVAAMAHAASPTSPASPALTAGASAASFSAAAASAAPFPAAGASAAPAPGGAAQLGNSLRAVIHTVLNEPWARIHKVKLGSGHQPAHQAP